MKGKAILAVMSILIIAAAGHAAVDTAIVATDRTSVDAVVASAAGSHAGVPVFVAAGGEVSQEVIATLKEDGINNIIIVGGPAVVSESAEEALENEGFSVVRLWGLERTGTALEVAKYFSDIDCAVLVDDTLSSEADTRRQTVAANIAVHEECTLVPVPAGTVPASVLDTLSELELDKVRYVGRGLPAEARQKLAGFALEEDVGDDDEIEEEIESEIRASATKVVIVAAPQWQDALGVGGQPNKNSVVRMVSSADALGDVITFIQENNITDVKVVGNPALAQDLADALREAGIEPSMVVGENASEVARAAWQASRGRFEEIDRQRGARIGSILAEQRAKFKFVLNNTEDELETERIELEAAEGDTSQLESRLNAALSTLEQAKSRLDAGDVREAKELWAEARSYFEARFRERGRIEWRVEERIRAEQEDFEDLFEDARDNLGDLSESVNEIRAECAASDDVEALVNRARSLREEMSAEAEAGNHNRAASLLRDVRLLVEQAKGLRSVCAERGDVPEFAREIAERHRERTRSLIQKIGEERRMEIESRSETRSGETRTESRARLRVESQSLDGDQVEVKSVQLDKPGYVVIHADADGAPGAVIGHSSLISGSESDVKISVDTEKSGNRVWAMLHYDDDGDGEYGFPDEDAPARIAGQIVQSPIRIVSESSSGSASGDSSMNAETSSETRAEVTVSTAPVEIEFDGSSYRPSSVSVEKGTTVRWVNIGSVSTWPASAVHPTHRAYPGSGLDKCGSGEEIFDACGGVAPGESYEFTFDEEGTWRYHDHLNPSITGTVVVE